MPNKHLFRNNLKKITNNFTNWIKADKQLIFEKWSLEPLHRINSGRNRAAKVLDFQHKVEEISDIYLYRGPTDRGFFTIYYKNSISQGQTGFGSKKGFLVIAKCPKGKELKIDYCQHSFSRDEEVPTKERHDRIRFGLNLPYKTPDQDLDVLARLIEADWGTEELAEHLQTKYNLKLIVNFHYTDRLWLNTPIYWKQTDKSLEFGIKSNGTYCSHPIIYKFSCVSKFKAVSLADLGAEEPGYYSHDDQMQILPEQVKAVKAFRDRFRANLADSEV